MMEVARLMRSAEAAARAAAAALQGIELVPRAGAAPSSGHSATVNDTAGVGELYASCGTLNFKAGRGKAAQTA